MIAKHFIGLVIALVATPVFILVELITQIHSIIRFLIHSTAVLVRVAIFAAVLSVIIIALLSF